MAQVFVFNATPSELTLIVNAAAPLVIAGTGNGYAPAARAVGRGRGEPQPGAFGDGSNSVQLFDPSRGGRAFSVNIGREIRPGSDLQLYLFSNHAVLVSESGESVYNF